MADTEHPDIPVCVGSKSGLGQVCLPAKLIRMLFLRDTWERTRNGEDVVGGMEESKRLRMLHRPVDDDQTGAFLFMFDDKAISRVEWARDDPYNKIVRLRARH
jgi:hypothetical protein